MVSFLSVILSIIVILVPLQIIVSFFFEKIIKFVSVYVFEFVDIDTNIITITIIVFFVF